MAAQDHIVYGPADIYLAPVGTAEPASPSAALPNDWVVLGQVNAEGIEESGITLRYNDTLFRQKVLGNTATISARLTAQDLEVSVSVVDMRPEVFAQVTGVDVTSRDAAPQVTGTKRVTLKRPVRPREFAVLVLQQDSPYDGVDLRAQYWFPRMVLDNRGETSFVKQPAAMIALTLLALSHNGEIGAYTAEDAAATT